MLLAGYGKIYDLRIKISAQWHQYIIHIYRRSIFQIDWLLAIWIFQSFTGGRKVDNNLRQLIYRDLFFDDAVQR